jgi:hypothetical protein
MPTTSALSTGLYCGQCGQDKPANQLKYLYKRRKVGRGLPKPAWEPVGRYCDSCMPGEKQMELNLNSEIEFKYVRFVPRKVEGQISKKGAEK